MSRAWAALSRLLLASNRHLFISRASSVRLCRPSEVVIEIRSSDLATSVVAKSQTNRANGRGIMRLLLTEDDPDIARVIAKGLREHGYAVDIAGDGEQAL